MAESFSSRAVSAATQKPVSRPSKTTKAAKRKTEALVHKRGDENGSARAETRSSNRGETLDALQERLEAERLKAQHPTTEHDLLLQRSSSNRLSDDTKRLVVQMLACGRTPLQVVRYFKETYGLLLSPQSVEKYNPTKVNGKKLCPEFTALFFGARQEYLADTNHLGVESQRFRVEKLTEISHLAYERGNFRLALQALEQGAKDSGGMFTNRREITGHNGGDIGIKTTRAISLKDTEGLTPEELDATERALLKMLARLELEEEAEQQVEGGHA